jgi:hypothetical protein
MSILKEKWLFIAGILVVFGTSIIVIYWKLDKPFVQPLPTLNTQPATSAISTATSVPVNDAIGLKTYTNKEYGFEFRYPVDWTVKEKTFGSYYSKFNLVVNPNLVKSSNFTISINIVLPEFPDRSFKNIKKITSEVIIDGVKGIKYEYEFEGSKETAIIMQLGEYKAILGTDDEQYVEVFRQILSTFKFLK